MQEEEEQAEEDEVYMDLEALKNQSTVSFKLFSILITTILYMFKFFAFPIYTVRTQHDKQWCITKIKDLAFVLGKTQYVANTIYLPPLHSRKITNVEQLF